MPRVLMLVVLVVAVTTTLAEARANRIHVTVKLAPCGRTSSLDQCTPWFGHYILDSQLLA
jgi:hypothetical protein